MTQSKPSMQTSGNDQQASPTAAEDTINWENVASEVNIMLELNQASRAPEQEQEEQED